MRRTILFLLLAVGAALPAWSATPATAGDRAAPLRSDQPQLAQAPAHLQTFGHGSVVVTGANGPHTFAVEVATTDAQKEQGLMFRQSMPQDSGMWFDYSREIGPSAFWMKNTFIPLDIIFVGADGNILTIYQRAVPKSLDSLDSGGPISGVLELNGGAAMRFGFKPGDPVSFHPS